MKTHSLTAMPLDKEHMAANVTEWLEDVIAKFNIPPKKVKVIVYDSGANVPVSAWFNNWSTY